MRLSNGISFLQSGALLVAASSCQRVPQHTHVDAEAIAAPELLRRVFAVNKVWLVPSSNDISYLATYRGAASKGGAPNACSRVEIRDGYARWELDVLDTRDASVKSSYVLVVQGQEETYFKSPRIEMTRKSRRAREMRTLRQGMQLSTAMHALAEHGIPVATSIVEQRPISGGTILVVETNLQSRRFDIGLGLYHFFLGRQSFPIRKVRINIKMPELIPVREEFLGNNSRVEYDEFEIIGDHVAPMRIRYFVEIPSRDGSNPVEMVFDCRFHEVENCWVSAGALSSRDGSPVAAMNVTVVSNAR